MDLMKHDVKHKSTKPKVFSTWFAALGMLGY